MLPATQGGGSMVTGIVLTVIAALCLANMDAMGKQLTAALPVLMVVWGRYMSQTLLSAGIFISLRGPGVVLTRRPLLHILRGTSIFGATLLMYHALAYIPLAEATAIVFVTPIMVNIMSIYVFKETMDWNQFLGTFCGFLRVLVILMPGLKVFSLHFLLPLAAALLTAFYLMLSKLVAVDDERWAGQIHATSVGALVLSISVMPIWQRPEPVDLVIMGVMGAAGLVGHFSILKALEYAPASRISPYLYAQVPFAMAISYFWFGDPLNVNTFVGAVVLIGSGMYLYFCNVNRHP